MLFTEGRFLLFLALVWALHWALRGHRARKALLLVASYGFYAAWDWRFLSLIVLSTGVDYVAGLNLGSARTPTARRGWLLLSLAVNLGLLGLFKYFDFFVDSAAELLRSAGMPTSDAALGLILPVGISFYTFQTLSYTLDVHAGRMRPTKDPLDFALFVGFFPQLVAGPIVRARDFLPQLERPRRFADVRVRACLTLFLLGFLKKAVLADTLARAVDPVFAASAAASPSDEWLAAALYGIQLYGDFSGYSDMAVATAGLLGYELPVNFVFPFLATSITDLWRRWHLTLTNWFRDYVYFPLGGSRCSAARSAVNLVATFALCGLWHGAQWTFVVWGLVNGVLLAAERAWIGRGLSRLPSLVRLPYMAAVWAIILVIFRAPDLAAAGAHLGSLVGIGGGAGAAVAAPLDPRLWLVVGVAWLVHLALARDVLPGLVARLPSWAFASSYGAVLALVLPWVAPDYQPFVYFQF